MSSRSRKSQMSVGEFLRSRREFLQISLTDLSDETGIPPKYLRRIERGQWSALPGGVYAKGFLRKYSRLVGANGDEIIKRYEKETTEAGDSPRTWPRVPLKEKIREQISVSPRGIRVAVIAVVLAAVLGYIGYQVSPILAQPELTITDPASRETVIHSDSFTIRGVAEEGAQVLLNDQTIGVARDGVFASVVELLPGLNTFRIKAVSRFGKETVVERSIIFVE